MLYAIGKPNEPIRQYVTTMTVEEAAQQCNAGEVYVAAKVVAPASIINGKIVVTQMTKEEIDAEFWYIVKDTRNGLLDQYRWTIAIDSPLTAECQAEWLDYYRILNRITVDYDDPQNVLWPALPALTYAEKI
jgi:hypothetical protein